MVMLVLLVLPELHVLRVLLVLLVLLMLLLLLVLLMRLLQVLSNEISNYFIHIELLILPLPPPLLSFSLLYSFILYI